MKLAFFLYFILFANLAFGRVQLLRDPSRKFEKKFSQAILLYYNKNYDKSLKLINQILATNENQKTLELKGLALKASENYQEAKKTYLKLIEKVNDAGLKPTEALGAYFDLAVLEFNFKNYESSLKYFDFCISNEFNNGASSYFKALIYSSRNELKNSIENFNLVLKSDATSLKASAALYLSDLYARQQSFDEAIYYLVKARDYSQEYKLVLSKELSEELNTNYINTNNKIELNINQLNTSQYLKNIAVFFTYDSNVLSVPQAGSVADSFTGKSSNKLTVKGLFGHATGFFDDTQNVWTYQFSGNVNENRATETGQFLTNDFTYIWNFKPYSDHVKSYRINLNSIFQYQVNPTSNKGAYGPYSIGATAGYSEIKKIDELKTQILDLALKYENFLQDPAFSIFMKKTGFEGFANYTYAWDSKVNYFNPSLGAGLSTRYSNGVEFKNYTGQIMAANQLYFSEKHKASLGASFSYANYYERPGEIRKDIITNYTWDENFKFSENLNFFINLNYTNNESNITDVYKFNRYLISAGSSYTF